MQKPCRKHAMHPMDKMTRTPPRRLMPILSRTSGRCMIALNALEAFGKKQNKPKNETRGRKSKGKRSEKDSNQKVDRKEVRWAELERPLRLHVVPLHTSLRCVSMPTRVAPLPTARAADKNVHDDEATSDRERAGDQVVSPPIGRRKGPLQTYTSTLSYCAHKSAIYKYFFIILSNKNEIFSK